MKFKYVCILLIFLCMISISAVSAADTSSNDIISTNTNDNLILEETINDDVSTTNNNNQIIEETINDDVSTTNDNDDEFISEETDETTLDSAKDSATLKEDPAPGTFTQLNETINGNSDNEINLAIDYKYVDDDSDLFEGIIINRSVTINGNGHTIDGAYKARIFHITEGQVTLNNITFTQGASSEGGAIFGDCIINNSQFYKNTANIGGAIYGNCIIDNSYFEKNNGNYLGGAIFGTCNINNSQFYNNTATFVGGAINGNATIDNSQFESNLADDSGGAIYGDLIYITNSQFYFNKASSASVDSIEKGGGAVYCINGTITNCYFDGNNMEHDYGDSRKGGGAIHFEQKGNVYSSHFMNNNDDSHGAAIWGRELNVTDSIFINNNCPSIDVICDYDDDFINKPFGGTNNWFGNNATDYNKAPTSNENITCESWLFLNATATKEVFKEGTSDIAFKLFVYNNTTKKISEYDNTILPEINLTVKTTKGNLNKDTIKPGDSVTFTATDKGNVIVTASVENYKYFNQSIKLKVGGLQANLTVTLNPTEINYGEPVTINLKYNSKATGTVKITLIGKEHNYTFTGYNLNKTIKITNSILADKYTVTVTYSGDSTFENETKSAKDKLVVKYVTKLTASGITTVYNVNKNLVITLKDSAGKALSGFKIAVNLNGAKTYTTDSKGQVKIATGKLAPKAYTAKVSFAGNDKYKAASTTAKVTVQKASPRLAATKVSTTYNVNKNLVITLKDNSGKAINGAQLTVNLGDNKNYRTDKNGQVKVATGTLVPKAYTVKASFAGNSYYKAASTSTKVVVKKASPKLTANAKTFKFEDKTKKYTIVLKNNRGKAMKNTRVSLNVNGKAYAAKTNSKGVATFKLTKLAKKGNFNAAITYAGDKYYNKVAKKAKITVKAPAWKTVAKGSKDHATVKKIQRALKDNGYYLSYKGRYLKVDGIFHDCTERSVKEFQRDKKLKVSGKVDYNTAKKLKIVS